MQNFWRYCISHKGNPLVWPVLLILAIVSLFYRIGLAIDSASGRDSVTVDPPLISIGNITVGGSGKTPLTIHIAKYFLGKGKKVGIVTGGYDRKIPGEIIDSGNEISSITVERTGDELLLLAESLPKAIFAVSDSKTKAACNMSLEYEVDLIIVDDAFQHRKLKRDLDIVLVDGTDNIFKDRLFPLGKLREPLKAMNRADLFIITKINYPDFEPGIPEELTRRFPNIDRCFTEFNNTHIESTDNSIPLPEISDRKVYFFAGLASFNNLKKHLSDNLQNLSAVRAFEDHCRYESGHIALIKKDIERYEPDIILTTQKDYVKIRNFDFGGPIYYLDLHLRFDPEFETKLYKRLDNLIGE